MKILTLLILSCILSFTSSAQWGPERTDIRKVKKHGKYGFVDAAGATVIPFVYDKAGYFFDSVAVVERDGKAGVVNTSGKEVVPCIYDEVQREGFDWDDNDSHDFRVKQNGRYGVVDKQGHVVIPVLYDKVTHAGHGFYTVKTGESFGLAGVNGRTIIPFGKYTSFTYQDSANFFIATTGKKYGCVDTFGNVVTPFVYDDIDNFKEYIHEYIYVNEYVEVKKDELYGCIDRKGKEVVPCQYDHLIFNYYGYWVASIDKKYGLINPAGKRVIPCIYDKLDYNENATVVAKLDKKVIVLDTTNSELFTTTLGYVESFDTKTGIAHINIDGYTEIDVDRNGDKVYLDYKPGAYAGVGQYCNGLTRVQNRQGYYGLMDAQGKEILPCRYDKIYGFYEGLARVVDNTKYGFVNLAGQLVVPCKYQSAASFSEGLAAVKTGDKWGYIDRTGKMIIAPVHEYAQSFSEDRALFRANGKYGFIDKFGNVVIPAVYERAGDFSEGLAYAANCEDHWQQCMGYIDRNGKMVIPFSHVGSAHDEFANGLACVGTYHKVAHSNPRTTYGVIDKAGNMVVPCKYSYAISFKKSDLCRVIDCEHHDCQSGVVNKKGKVVLPCEYGSLDICPGNIIAASKDYKWALFDSTGRQLTRFEWDKLQGVKEFPLAAEKDKRWGFIDTQGKTVIPFIYDDVLWKDYESGFHEGFAAIKKNGKWGYIDRQGQPLTQLIYDEVCHFSEGMAAVKKDGKWAYINYKGEQVITFK